MKKLKKAIVIREICLCAILLALILITKAIFNFIHIINGFPLLIELIFYCAALIVINTYYFKIGFLILVPFTLFVFGTNGHLFFDFILPYWSFFTFIFFTPLTINIQSKKKKILMQSFYIIIFSIIGYSISLMSFTISGNIWWGLDWKASFIFNLPIIATTMGINTGVMLLCSYPISLICDKLNSDIYY